MPDLQTGTLVDPNPTARPVSGQGRWGVCAKNLVIPLILDETGGIEPSA